MFLGTPAAASNDNRRNTVEAFASAPSLLHVSKERLLRELAPQGVIGVIRLGPRGDTKNPGLRFRFQGDAFPHKLRTGFDSIKLRKWIKSPQS